MVNSTSILEADFVTPPGDTLLELLEERGMTQSELAQRTGRPIKTINEIIHGKKALTAETAMQLERVLGAPASFWLNRERIYREHLARQTADAALRSQQDWLDNFPVRDMQNKGLLPKTGNKAKLLVALLQFMGLAEPNNWEIVYQSNFVRYRKTAAFESSTHALSVWLRQGQLEAQELFCDLYNKALFSRLLSGKIRALTCEPPHIFQDKLVDLCAGVGVAVVFVPQIKGARVSGAARWLDKNKALIQLSLRYKTNDHFWFSFFHEAGHIIKHGKRDVFIDFVDGEEDKVEEEANKFAAAQLIAPAAYGRFVVEEDFSKTAVRRFAEEIGIAPGIVVGRLQHDGHVPFSHLNDLKERFDWTIV